MMAKLLLIIVSFSISTDVLFGDDACSHYNNINCVQPKILQNGHYANQWIVDISGKTKEQAKNQLEQNGFIYLSPVENNGNLHIVTKEGTHDKHVMPNTQIIESLKTQKNVRSVSQKHVLGYSPDKLFSILNTDQVECIPLDPNTIKMNDGKENLERIYTSEAPKKDYPSPTARPTSKPKLDTDNTYEEITEVETSSEMESDE